MLRVLVTVRFLEQCDPGELTPPRTSNGWIHLTRVLRPSPGLARFLYANVGEGYRWSGRLDWDDRTWRRTLDRPETELWISWWRGSPTGFAELTGGIGTERTTTRIAYLGLLPAHRGRGLGGHLVTHATQRAWTVHRRTGNLPRVERVELNTSTLDTWSALPNYVKRGFRIVREEEREITVPGHATGDLVAPRRPFDS